MRRTNLIFFTLFVAAVTLTAPSAYAQMGEGSPGMAPPPPSNTASASFSSASSGHGFGLGVGAVTMLNGTSGALVTWGASGWHADGFFGLHRYNAGGSNTTSVSFGGRFWYHVHAASFADFSLGGGLGFVHWKSYPGADSHNDLSLEVGGQIRTFIVPNVALLADLGLGAVFSSNDNIMIGAQSLTDSGNPAGGGNFVAGTLGIAYFFE